MKWWKNFVAMFRLGVTSSLEYRFNFLIDAAIQPLVTTFTELFLWHMVFFSLRNGTGQTLLGGFSLHQYLAYALWAPFFSRIGTNWSYEYKMIRDIEMGNINSILVRPISFFEYYLGQLLGYKFLTLLVSFSIPLIASIAFDFPIQISRMPVAICLLIYYLVFVYLLSFCISCLAFFWNRIYTLTVIKNMTLWFLSGEMIPLDLLPGTLKSIIAGLPFASGAYLPVAYLTGRISISEILQGATSISASIFVVGLVAYGLWRSGLRTYAGTGA